MEILRRNIPELRSKKIRKGLRSIKSRSYPVGEDSYLRCFIDELLPLKIEFQFTEPNMMVRLSTDVSGQWEDLDFLRQEDSSFTIDLKFKKSGIFRFKVQFSYNQGQTWFWDSVPHTYIYVDPANFRKLKIYTLIPTVSGNFSDWKSELSRIKEMGFDAVHLLPVTALDISESPYSAHDLFSLDYSYNIPGDLRDPLDQWEDFVIEAKRLGIRLCLDIVLNHIGITSKMALLCPDWLATDSSEADSLKRAGCWHGMEWIKWNDLALIKYDHPNKLVKNELWHYMLQYVLFWSHYASFTGGMIRLDNLHSSDQDFLHYLITILKKEYPELVIFAELFTDQNTTSRMVYDYNLNLLMATPWTHPYAGQIREYLNHVHRSYSHLRYLIPLNSHDSRSAVAEYGGASVTVARYAVYSLLGTGHTGVTQGSEFGFKEKIHFIGRQKRIEYSTCEHNFSKEFRIINDLLEHFSVFQTGSNLLFVDQNHGAAVAGFRFNKEKPSTGFLVIASLDPTGTHELHLNLEPLGTEILGKKLFDLIDKEELYIDNLYKQIRLGPGEVMIFSIGVES